MVLHSNLELIIRYILIAVFAADVKVSYCSCKPVTIVEGDIFIQSWCIFIDFHMSGFSDFLNIEFICCFDISFIRFDDTIVKSIGLGLTSSIFFNIKS